MAENGKWAFGLSKYAWLGIIVALVALVAMCGQQAEEAFANQTEIVEVNQ